MNQEALNLDLNSKVPRQCEFFVQVENCFTDCIVGAHCVAFGGWVQRQGPFSIQSVPPMYVDCPTQSAVLTMNTDIAVDAQPGLLVRSDIGRKRSEVAANWKRLLGIRKRSHAPLHRLNYLHSMPWAAVVMQTFPN